MKSWLSNINEFFGYRSQWWASIYKFQVKTIKSALFSLSFVLVITTVGLMVEASNDYERSNFLFEVRQLKSITSSGASTTETILQNESPLQGLELREKRHESPVRVEYLEFFLPIVIGCLILWLCQCSAITHRLSEPSWLLQIDWIFPKGFLRFAQISVDYLPLTHRVSGMIILVLMFVIPVLLLINPAEEPDYLSHFQELGGTILLVLSFVLMALINVCSIQLLVSSQALKMVRHKIIGS